MKNEQRQSVRRNVRIPVLWWEGGSGPAAGAGTETTSHDLSESGLSFDTATIRPIGSRLTAELHLPGLGSPVVAGLTVTRNESIVGRDSYRIGTSFVDLAAGDRAAVAACLERLNLYSLVKQARELGASDLHLTVGRPPVVRTEGRLRNIGSEPVEDGRVKAMLYPLLSNEQIRQLEQGRELDFAFSPDVGSRFRVNLHFQRGFLEATLRSVPTATRTFEELGLPSDSMAAFCGKRSGLILIAGTTGSGKTTTMAAMIDQINRNQQRVVITIEDPIEFTHSGVKSIIKQRELGSDTLSYAEALRRALRQDPDVIVVGELTDADCVQAALRAAETGHLVISTVHAPDSGQAIERLVNLFPPEHAAAIGQQISSSLIGVLFQTLVPGKRRSRVLATELLITNLAIRNMIREGRFNQIRMSLQTGRNVGMYTLESRLEELHRAGSIEASVLRQFRDS